MHKKNPTKSKALDITAYPEKWRKLLSEFVGRSDKKQTLREWCKERDLSENTTYRWITSEAVKAEEKRQANQRQISGKSTSRLPIDLPVDLPIRQAVFVEEYVTDFNGTNAAKRAGYSEKSANKIAPQLLGKTRVKKAINERVIERTKGLAVTSEIALAELANLAMADMGDVADWNGTSVTVRDSSGLARHITSAIAEVSQTSDGVKIKLHGKTSALDKLLKILGARTTAEDAIRAEVQVALESGELTAEQASMKLWRYGIESPPALLEKVKAELRMVEPPEEDINPAPPKEAAISMQEYAAFVEWQKAQAQARSAALIAKIEAEGQEYNDGEA